ncbi:hypothetical protein [Amycolatopsis sp. NPDC004378]
MNARVLAARIAFGLFSAAFVLAGAGTLFLVTHEGPDWAVLAATVVTVAAEHAQHRVADIALAPDEQDDHDDFDHDQDHDNHDDGDLIPAANDA